MAIKLTQYERPLSPRGTGSQPIVSVYNGKMCIYGAIAKNLELENKSLMKVYFDEEGNPVLDFLPPDAKVENSYTLSLVTGKSKALQTSISDLVREGKVKDDSIYVFEPLKDGDKTYQRLVYKNAGVKKVKKEKEGEANEVN